MDILNFISWIKGKRQVTSVDPAKTLLPVALKDGRRDDEYLTGAISVEDFASQIATPGSIATSGSSLYSTNPSAGPGFSTDNGIFLGADAGFLANNSSYSIFLGNGTGAEATFALRCNFIGNGCGYQAANLQGSNFIGVQAGFRANIASYSNFFGWQTGWDVTSGQHSNFFGYQAGKDAISGNHCNYIGKEAGNATTGNNNNAFGENALKQANCSNVNAFGSLAGSQNGLSGMTIFSNSSLPSYANRAAALAAITIPNGAVTGNTYLYYNQATFAIEGVRL